MIISGLTCITCFTHLQGMRDVAKDKAEGRADSKDDNAEPLK